MMSILVGRQAPDFTTAAVKADGSVDNQFNFSNNTKGRYAVLFFYPLDFTFVCPSELLALHNRMAMFKEKGVEVITVSIDSHFTHSAWRNTDIKQGGIGQVDYTMVSDVNHRICQAYGIEHPEAFVAFRAAFIIDKAGVVRSQIVNDLPLGRNIDELLRLIDALEHHEAHGEVCPAGWLKGKGGMKATKQGVAEYLAENFESL
jgi:peroxiredoxin (alkyl hydroperoxide reductase subunit C)